MMNCNSQFYDGWLTAGEMYGLDLENTNLVVLSACETNLDNLSEGDEVVGLTRALIFAGTPRVIASLWAIEDEATSLLMERFYTHLKDGMGKAEALRQAQIEIREDYPNPYYWSAFVLSGDGGNVRTALTSTQTGPTGEETEQRIPWGWLIIGGGILVIIVVGGILWWQRMRWT